jgi:uncharacterized membrane protein YjjP (DUF1212 family)
MNDETHPEKVPLSREALREVNEISLLAGALLMQNGAETARVEETVHRIGTALGANWLDILVSPNAIIVTSSSGDEFRTRLRRVLVLGVNMRVIDEVNSLSRRISAGDVDRHTAKEELTRISHLPAYNRWLIVAMVGLGCAAFSRLFGGDAITFIITFLAASIAMLTRQELSRRAFNPLLITIVTAFVASTVALLMSRLNPVPTATALLSSVLLLIPGVHLINAAQDIIKGHLVTGIVRGFLGAVITACIALGILLAMSLFQQAVL